MDNEVRERRNTDRGELAGVWLKFSEQEWIRVLLGIELRECK